jgi:hypothetical protein
MQMKLLVLGTLFAFFCGTARAATNMVYTPAGYIPAGTSLTVAQTSFDNYYATMQATAQNQMVLVQQQMLQTQFQNGLVAVAESSFSDWQREKKKGKKSMKVKTTEDIPYYKQTEYETNDDTTPVEQTAVPPTNEETVAQIAKVQKSLEVQSNIPAPDCPPEVTKETPTYSAWDDYIKNIQATAKAAKPPISAKAVQKTVDFLKANRERLEKTLQNRNYAVINDFTQDSTNKRMIVLNLKTKKVERYLVSHGHGKPVNSAKAPGFSNTAESDLTPPGFLVMKERVVLKSDDERPIKDRIQMDGLEPSNANARNPRGIIFHGGPVSADEVKKYGMLGTSKGCPQVTRSDYEALKGKLQGGVLMYNFTPADNK